MCNQSLNAYQNTQLNQHVKYKLSAYNQLEHLSAHFVSFDELIIIKCADKGQYMDYQQLLGRAWTRYTIAVVLVEFASLLRIWPLHILGSTLVRSQLRNAKY